MRQALIKPPSESRESPRLSPNEHLSLLIELLRPERVELSRRLIAALMLVPEAERDALVGEIERRIVRTYAEEDRLIEMHVVGPPVQRDGYIEQIHTTYAVPQGESRSEEADSDKGTTMAS